MQILSSRENRVERRNRIHIPDRGCLICFTLNIPGSVKLFPLAKMAFEEGISQIRQLDLPGFSEINHLMLNSGFEANFVSTASPNFVKEKAISIEALHPLGRLFDIDVFDCEKNVISRIQLSLAPRTCFVCNNSAKECARNRSHTTQQVQNAVATLLKDFFIEQAAKLYGSYAEKALLSELSATPKPGLVDRNNSGSHNDMDYALFLESIRALSPWFSEFFITGATHSSDDTHTLFSALRAVGVNAEVSMFSATHGINTHKGFIFLSSIFLGSLGRLYAQSFSTPRIEDVLSFSSALGAESMRDFAVADSFRKTNGYLCFQKFKISGPRGEAANGFPSVVNVGLPHLQKYLDAGFSLNDASTAALLAIISSVWDTNMIKRGSLSRAADRQKQASEILAVLTPQNLSSTLKELDASYIRENLSPGGAADLLAMSLMLYFMARDKHLIVSPSGSCTSKSSKGCELF